MKNSTVILVILMLAGATALERKVRGPASASCFFGFGDCGFADCAADRCDAPSPEMLRLQDEVGQLDDKLKGLSSALRSIDRSEKSIGQLINQARRDRNKARDLKLEPQVTEIYNKNVAALEERLKDIREQKVHLVTNRNNLKAKRIALQSDYELARVDARYATRKPKPSPLEALENAKASPGSIVFED